MLGHHCYLQDKKSPTYSQLQAYGILSLQLDNGTETVPVRAGTQDRYFVVVSTAIVDAYLSSRHGMALPKYMFALCLPHSQVSLHLQVLQSYLWNTSRCRASAGGHP